MLLLTFNPTIVREYGFYILFSAISTWIILFYLIPILNLTLLDHPNERSSHRIARPRGGGISFVLVTIISSVITMKIFNYNSISYLPLISLPLAFVGLIDDRINLSSSVRYTTQFFTAAGILLASPLIYRLSENIGNYLIIIIVIVFTLIAITALINFTNFMDGMDGLVAGCMIIILSCSAIHLSINLWIWVCVGSLIGFIPWNWSQSRVFMGDIGSTFLGAIYAGLVLQTSSWQDALGLLLVGTPLLGDACICVIRRFIAGQSVGEAHSLHLYQRLHKAGLSQARVSSIYISASVLLTLTFLLGGIINVICMAIVIIIFGFWLDQQVAVKFKTASLGQIT